MCTWIKICTLHKHTIPSIRVQLVPMHGKYKCSPFSLFQIQYFSKYSLIILHASNSISRTVKIIPQCPLPTLQLKGNERKKLHRTNTLLASSRNTLLASSRDQKRAGSTVKAFLSVKKLFFMKKFIFF